MAQPTLSLRTPPRRWLRTIRTALDPVLTGTGRLLFMAVVVGAGVGVSRHHLEAS